MWAFSWESGLPKKNIEIEMVSNFIFHILLKYLFDTKYQTVRLCMDAIQYPLI